MSLDLNILKNYFFRTQIKKSVLEPFTCIIRCATLNYLPIDEQVDVPLDPYIVDVLRKI